MLSQQTALCFPGSICPRAGGGGGTAAGRGKEPCRGGQQFRACPERVCRGAGWGAALLCKTLWIAAASELTSSVKQRLSLELKDPWQGLE